MSVNVKRTIYKGGDSGPGPVIYWMMRDQRVADNWALLYAQQIALEHKAPLAVVFCLAAPHFLKASVRIYDFMLAGLRELESELQKKQIPFFLLCGKPDEEIPAFLKKVKAGALVTEFFPLHPVRAWKEIIRQKTKLAYYVVDAHNVIPCWTVSQKQEFGAYTIRPKINKLLPDYLEEFPAVKKHPHAWTEKVPAADWAGQMKKMNPESKAGKVDWIQPGERAASQALRFFIEKRLRNYNEGRNDPAGNGQSDLSPYFHFGQLSPQRAALEVSKLKQNEHTEAFLEELIVRRELSDNFCFYNKNYDNFEGFPAWAKETLHAHRKDKRPFLYNKEQFENAETHDPYWNAAQLQMVRTGKMHGYMRMYWAKKLLEWTKSPEEAQQIAIELNDKYELDGRDPNGYTGIAWSIGGVHDRPWTERPVFGKIRYMNDKGLDRKFEMETYVEQYSAFSKPLQKKLL